MRLEGKLWKDSEKFWLIEIPMLDLMTQGRTKKEALSMMVDAMETLVNRKGFHADIQASKNGKVSVGTNDLALLIALLLKRKREKSGLSLEEVSRRLGVRSRNAYARYEQGTSVPTVSKLTELLRVIDPSRDVVLSETPVSAQRTA